MKLSGTAALYTQLKELENAVAVTKRLITVAEDFEKITAPPEKKAVRRKRQPKALPYDGVIGSNSLVASKANGIDAED